jgi:hypothetical protein
LHYICQLIISNLKLPFKLENFLKIILAVGLIIIGLTTTDGYRQEFVGAGFIILLSIGLVDGGVFIVNNHKRLVLYFHSKFLALNPKRQYIRFSMSYQYRIRINDKYLLVRNGNEENNWYQHVGGKYKRLEETQKILADFEATDDTKMKTTDLKKGDLAVFIPAKNTIKFLDWFNTEKDREISHWREFYEELLGGKSGGAVLSSQNFPYVNYRFVKSVCTPIKKAPIQTGWNCWELLQYDVLELIPTPAQQEELEKLFDKGDTDYIKWADASLIDTLGYVESDKKHKYKIGAHAKWVLNLKWSNV